MINLGMEKNKTLKKFTKITLISIALYIYLFRNSQFDFRTLCFFILIHSLVIAHYVGPNEYEEKKLIYPIYTLITLLIAIIPFVLNPKLIYYSQYPGVGVFIYAFAIIFALWGKNGIHLLWKK